MGAESGSATSKILVVDDDPALRRLFRAVLQREGHEVVLSGEGADGLHLAESGCFDVILADLAMAPVGGLQILEAARAVDPEALVIIVTGNATVQSAIEALKRGAYDYILKPVENDALALLVRRALEHRALEEEKRRTAEALAAEKRKTSALVRDLRPRFELDRILGHGAKMREILDLAKEVVNTDSTVLLLGESGTGKGFLARAMHLSSVRAENPFVEVNCSVYPEGLLQSELFGHEKGAFTGAHQRKRGRFELAAGGTVFLDEIGEVSLATQVMLLRFLQERRFERVGGEETLGTDARVVAATNRDLAAAVRRGEFREDLFYRLNVIPIHLPPLRDRIEEIPVLGEELLRIAAERLDRPVEGFSAEAMEALLAHAWPGNIRELENVTERAVLLCHGRWIERRHLPREIAGTAAASQRAVTPPRRSGEGDAASPSPLPIAGLAPHATPQAPEAALSLEAAERDHIVKVLDACGWNKKRAAECLGINRSSLYSKLRRLGIVCEKRLAGVS